MATKANPATGQQEDIDFLTKYLRTRRKWYADSPDLLPCDLLPEPSEADRTEYEAEEERVARLADDNGFDGSLFRAHLLETPRNNPLSREAIRQLAQKIEAIPRIIAKLERSKSAGTEQPLASEAKMLTVRQVAEVLNCGESTVRERDRKGLIPKPVKLGGSLRWDGDELDVWRKHRCPPRAEWERNRERFMQEVSDATV